MPLKESSESHSKRITCNPLPTIGEDELRLLVSLLSSDSLLDGKDIDTFERMFSRYLGVKYCVSFGRGRVALYSILRALGVGSSDEVILPPYTCFVVPKAIYNTGARPVYADIDPQTFNMDVERTREKITPSTKAIVPHHLFGHPADMKPFWELAEDSGIAVIEDCAQALGAVYNGKKVGTASDVSFFSFDFSKNITTGQGGMAVTDSLDVAEKLREVRDGFPLPPKTYAYSMILALIRGTYLLEPSASLTRALVGEIVNKSTSVASNFRYLIREKSLSTPTHPNLFCLANSLAKIGIFQLQRADTFNKRRMEIAQEYDEFLMELGKTSVHVTPNASHVFLRYALRVDSHGECRKFFERFNVVLGDWFDYVVHPYALQRETLGYKMGSCPNAEAAARTVVNVPNHPKMNLEDVEYVKKTLQLFYKRE
jgi:perosamine synthetase